MKIEYNKYSFTKSKIEWYNMDSPLLVVCRAKTQ